MDKSMQELKEKIKKKQSDLFRSSGWEDAPFSYSPEEARAWHYGREQMIQWVLERFPNG